MLSIILFFKGVVMKVKMDLSAIGLNECVSLPKDQKKVISEMINKIIGTIRDTERAKKLAVDQNIDVLVKADENECMQLCQELLAEIKDVATTNDPKFVYNLLATRVREKNAEMEIDEEFKLLHLKIRANFDNAPAGKTACAGHW